MTLTIERLRQVLSYEPDSGVFRWRITRSGVQAGDIAGCLDKSRGYRLISVDWKLYRAARLAWFYIYEEWPPEHIDHKNMVRSDDRIANLRPATRTQNYHNTRARKRNLSGLKGVSYEARSGSWYARIMVDRILHRLGRFKTPEAAHAAYAAAAKKFHGEFGRAD